MPEKFEVNGITYNIWSDGAWGWTAYDQSGEYGDLFFKPELSLEDVKERIESFHEDGAEYPKMRMRPVDGYSAGEILPPEERLG